MVPVHVELERQLAFFITRAVPCRPEQPIPRGFQVDGIDLFVRILFQKLDLSHTASGVDGQLQDHQSRIVILQIQTPSKQVPGAVRQALCAR
jgi:hypothetical protein